MASCGAALIEPVDRLANRWFFVHMIQHLMLLEVAPLLIVAGPRRDDLRVQGGVPEREANEHAVQQ